MNLTLQAMKPEEQLYAFSQSHQLMMQCGSVGHLRGDFNRDGKEFHTTWDTHIPQYRTDDFLEEFDDVIQALHSDEHFGGVLKDRVSMRDYCDEHPDAAYAGAGRDCFGFRADTEKFAYLIRCSPAHGEYNFYVYPYVAKWLDKHIGRAAQGISIINSSYQEQFRLQDGQSIRMIHADGEKAERVCRFIDETHIEVGGRLFHSCEFAEMLERTGCTAEPVTPGTKTVKNKPAKNKNDPDKGR